MLDLPLTIQCFDSGNVMVPTCFSSRLRPKRLLFGLLESTLRTLGRASRYGMVLGKEIEKFLLREIEKEQ